MSQWTLIMLQLETWKERPAVPVWRKSPQHSVHPLFSSCFCSPSWSSPLLFSNSYIQFAQCLVLFRHTHFTIQTFTEISVVRLSSSFKRESQVFGRQLAGEVSMAQWAASGAPVIFSVVFSLCICCCCLFSSWSALSVISVLCYKHR